MVDSANNSNEPLPVKPILLTNQFANANPSGPRAPKPTCACLDPQFESDEDARWPELALHTEEQDTECDAWKHLLEIVDRAAKDGRETFAPAKEMPWNEWVQIVTLPQSILKLKAVKELMLYGSSLVRIPPEIGQMSNLEKFEPYTSYRLHWFPFEIVHCQKLKKSCVSTRAIYGNFKYRMPFPRLPSISAELTPKVCSICSGPFTAKGPQQVWISLKVATDVLPLMVHACSVPCVSALPQSAPNYVMGPHFGGREMKQPPTRF